MIGIGFPTVDAGKGGQDATVPVWMYVFSSTLKWAALAPTSEKSIGNSSRAYLQRQKTAIWSPDHSGTKMQEPASRAFVSAVMTAVTTLQQNHLNPTTRVNSSKRPVWMPALTVLPAWKCATLMLARWLMITLKSPGTTATDAAYASMSALLTVYKW